MMMTITAQVDHRSGDMHVAYIRFNLDWRTTLINERPWHCCPVVVVYLRPKA